MPLQLLAMDQHLVAECNALWQIQDTRKIACATFNHDFNIAPGLHFLALPNAGRVVLLYTQADRTRVRLHSAAHHNWQELRHRLHARRQGPGLPL